MNYLRCVLFDMCHIQKVLVFWIKWNHSRVQSSERVFRVQSAIVEFRVPAGCSIKLKMLEISIFYFQYFDRFLLEIRPKRQNKREKRIYKWKVPKSACHINRTSGHRVLTQSLPPKIY